MNIENNNPPVDTVHCKIFECDVCNKTYSCGSSLSRHKTKHTCVEGYECRVCQKRFLRKYKLDTHFNTHTLRYRCPICNQAFQTQKAVKDHFHNEHDLAGSCPLCSFIAGTSTNLEVHFFNRHGIDVDHLGWQAPLLVAFAQQGFSLENALTISEMIVSETAGPRPEAYERTEAGSIDNATPMHFLPPPVDTSMTYTPASVFGSNLDQHRSHQRIQSDEASPNCFTGPASPQSVVSNSDDPSSSRIQTYALGIDQETSIPSLIAIKQEPDDETYEVADRNEAFNLSTSPSNTVPMQKAIWRSKSNHGCSKASPNATGSNDDATITDGVITSTGIDRLSDSSLRSTMDERSLSNLQCVFCGIAFPVQTLYFLHKRAHSDANPWKCNICGVQCFNVYEFNCHLLIKGHQ